MFGGCCVACMHVCMYGWVSRQRRFFPSFMGGGGGCLQTTTIIMTSRLGMHNTYSTDKTLRISNSVLYKNWPHCPFERRRRRQTH